MPTYQYRCTGCGDELEVVQKFSDAPLTDCPACEGSLRKVFSPVGIVFKGSGFYRTDSRNGSSGDGAKKKDREPAGAKSAGSSSADPGKSPANGSSESSSSPSSESSGTSGSSGKSAEKSSSAAAPAASKAG